MSHDEDAVFAIEKLVTETVTKWKVWDNKLTITEAGEKLRALRQDNQGEFRLVKLT